MIDASVAAMIGAPHPAFRILGPLEVHGPDDPVRIPPGRQQAILASLLIEANRVVSTDHLVDVIWEERAPDTARTQVQICVSRLRKSLADAGIHAPIVTTPPGYLLQLQDNALDLHVFNRLVGQGRRLAQEGSGEQAAQLLRAAADLWRGSCLDGISSDALRTRALRLDEERLIAIETYLDLELELGHYHRLVGEISRLVHEHPLRERLRGQLMLALHRSGRQAEALEAYRAGRDLLIEELGLEPGDELRRLETAILSGDAGGAPAHARQPARQPGRILVAPEPAGAPEPAASPYQQDKPHQLPADTADFVGGADLVDAATLALTGTELHRAVGVVVIVGKPGIGKSTIAIHIGHQLGGEHFPDGQLYCNLRGIRSEAVPAGEVLARFLRALGIPGAMLPDTVDERAEMYRSLLASRRVLVVLDDAASESQILPLLPGSNTCGVLVTSRTRMTGVPGAQRIEMDVLTNAQALELVGRVIGAHRVAAEPEAADALVRTVGGLPLALRIIAARLAARPHWTLESMVHRLANERHRLDELAHGEMTMRASLSLTHDGLGRADQRLFRLLCLAEGPTVPGWIAGALLDEHRSRPSDLLEPLIDVQMLDVDAMERTGEFRYRFHDIIRMFAREQLAEHESRPMQTAVLQRMIGGWLSLAEQAHRRIYGGDYTILHGRAPRWHPPADYVARVLVDPLGWLDSEQVNLCTAVEQAAEAQLDELCWDLATTLVTLFEARGYLDQWERTHRHALAAVKRAGNKRGTAAVLGSMGTLYISRRQPEEARAALNTALDLFGELGDSHGQGLCRRDLALLERQRDDDDSALVLYDRALRDFDRAGDVVGRAIVLTQSAHIWMRRGHTTTAHTQLDEALEIYRSVGYTGGEAQTLRRMGQVLMQRGEHDQGERILTEVLAAVRRSGDVIGEGHLLRNLGEANVEIGRLAQAREFFEQALAVREQIMDLGGAAVVRLDLSRLLERLGERPRAAELLQQAALTFRERRMAVELREAEQLLALIGPPGD